MPKDVRHMTWWHILIAGLNEAQICAQGRVLQRPELARYCTLTQFPPMISVEEFRAKLAGK